MKNELVAIRTSDDVILHGALFEGDPDKPAIVLLHGAMMNFYTGIGAFLPTMLAQQGYTCLSANLRGHDLATAPDDICRKITGSIYEDFRDTVLDVDALIGYLKDRGCQKVILVAHSQASFKILYSFGERKYPNVTGMALVSPPPSALEMTTFLVGTDGYEQGLSEAREAIAQGDENHLIVCKSRGNLPFVFSARTFLSFSQPKEMVNARNLVKNVACPLLIVRGTRDLPPITRELINTMLANSARPDLVQIVEIEGASHYYTGCESFLTETLVDWMKGLD